MRQGLVLVAVCAKYRSTERSNAGYLTLSDLTPKIKLRCQFYTRFNKFTSLIFLSTGIEFS